MGPYFATAQGLLDAFGVLALAYVTVAALLAFARLLGQGIDRA